MTAAGSDGGPATAARSRGVRDSPWLWAGRVAGAGLVVWMGWIHLHLWNEGYRYIGSIGPLFMANFVASMAAALVLLAVPTRRLLALAALLGAGLALGTLAGLLVSIHFGLFGFTDSWNAPFARLSLTVEIVAAVALLLTATGAWWSRPRGDRRPPG